MRLESWLHYQIYGVPPPRKNGPRRHFRRGPARNWKYRQWIRSLPCLVCGHTPAEAAHTGEGRGLRQKSSDYSCVPLCGFCHRLGPHSYHVLGKKAFEQFHLVDLANLVEQMNALWFEYAGRVK